MFGVDDERHVHHFRRARVGRLARHHAQKIFGEALRGVGLDKELAPSRPLDGRHEGGELRREREGDVIIVLHRHLEFLRVQAAEHGDGGAQRAHGVAFVGDVHDQVFHFLGDSAAQAPDPR